MSEEYSQEDIAVIYHLLPQAVKDYARHITLGKDTPCIECGLPTDARTGYIHTTYQGCQKSICRVCYSRQQQHYSQDLIFIDWDG